MCTISLSYPLTLGFLQTSLKPTQEGWGRGHSHKEEEVPALLFVPQEGQSHGGHLPRSGAVTILSGGGPVAPTGCTFRLATGRVEKKKNNNNNKKTADHKLADKVSERVSAMQLD
ncbi:hypothetical protein FVER14953_04212 [Fusarium verticillioides]|nr:hypothetical protein FVER14953_04212 [Fusarium verticillioides]